MLQLVKTVKGIGSEAGRQVCLGLARGCGAGEMPRSPFDWSEEKIQPKARSIMRSPARTRDHIFKLCSKNSPEDVHFVPDHSSHLGHWDKIPNKLSGGDV